MNGFLGDSPLRVLVKLVVLSFLVGLVMSAFGWTPGDIYRSLVLAVERVWYMGFAAIDNVVGYFLLGAAIVVPVFLLIRLANYRR
ncbi:MAG TPA: DUF6460 domain-containing protein [Rhizobiaceae bacterium]|nr:DUF6460 domain-containing protein [Rhizobiaceae bacterium]